MKKTFILLSLMMLMLLNMSCNNKSKNSAEEADYKAKMEAVSKEVENTRKHDTALLLVSFGSTCEAPQNTFKAMKKQFASWYDDMDIYFSFTSEICISRCAEKGLNYYSPSYYLRALGEAGYKKVCVQSLHVIPGKEYELLKKMVSDFHSDADFADVSVYLGAPLLNDMNDIRGVALSLNDICRKDLEDGRAVVFMGHGNSEDSTYVDGNARYLKLEQALKVLDRRYYVATVDMKGNLVTDMIKRMKADGIKEGTEIICRPLMSTAGDHANNDMLGGTDEDNPEEGSWRYELVKAGFRCPVANCHVVGLGDYPEIVSVWIGHMDQALEEGPSFGK